MQKVPATSAPSSQPPRTPSAPPIIGTACSNGTTRSGPPHRRPYAIYDELELIKAQFEIIG